MRLRSRPLFSRADSSFPNTRHDNPAGLGDDSCAFSTVCHRVGPMPLFQNLAALAVRGVVGGACRAFNLPENSAADVIAQRLLRHLTDHSQRLVEALERAHEQAWKALEVALAGNS